MMTMTFLQKTKSFLPLVLLVLAGYWIVQNFDDRLAGTNPKRHQKNVYGTNLPLIENGSIALEPVRLADLKGEPVVLNFWATWCQLCSLEKEFLVLAHQKFQSQVHFLGVIAFDKWSRIQNASSVRETPYRSLFDVDDRFARSMGVRGLPQTFVVDKWGFVRHRIDGPLDRSKLMVLEKQLQRLINEPPRSIAGKRTVEKID